VVEGTPVSASMGERQPKLAWPEGFPGEYEAAFPRYRRALYVVHSPTGDLV